MKDREEKFVGLKKENNKETRRDILGLVDTLSQKTERKEINDMRNNRQTDRYVGKEKKKRKKQSNFLYI